MPNELNWLALTTAVTGLLWMPYILDRIAVRGLAGAMANPKPDALPNVAQEFDPPCLWRLPA